MPIQDWNLHDINCLLVPATNNGNESANGRFSGDFGPHPPCWNLRITMKDELERVSRDIPSILYGSLKPKPSPLYDYDSLKYDREAKLLGHLSIQFLEKQSQSQVGEEDLLKLL